MYTGDDDDGHDCCPNCTDFTTCDRCKKYNSPSQPIPYNRLSSAEVDRLTDKLREDLMKTITDNPRRRD